MAERGRHGEPNIFSPKPLTLTSSKGEPSIQINDVEKFKLFLWSGIKISNAFNNHNFNI